MTLVIKPVNEPMLDAILDLFGQYQVFYKATADRPKNGRFLRALLQSPQEGAQFLAFDQGKAVGFATREQISITSGKPCSELRCDSKPTEECLLRA